MTKRPSEDIVKSILAVCAFFSTIIIFLIIVFLFREGLPIFGHTNIFDFVTGGDWTPQQDIFGSSMFIISSLFVTLGAIVIAVPIGLLTAIFLAELAPPRAREYVKPAIELLAGIPSVIYGLFGLIIIVKYIRIAFDRPTGESILAGAIILAIMILPTIISISEDAIRQVPRSFKEGSLALGATNWETISRTIVPSAKSGILASVILGVGRAIGETMAVVLVVGNVEQIPKSLFDAGEPLTSTILLEMGEAAVGSLHYSALFALGILLFVMVMVLNIISNAWLGKGAGRYG
ncbi:MAG: phosphate ABC transporter permease subunit PstC [Candidatus Methanofastidiosa archaeon]|nr:phosphate ABC transporter permease subunit PstC [Candidatus Methanofastidiosa archaeon]